MRKKIYQLYAVKETRFTQIVLKFCDEVQTFQADFILQ